MMQDPDRIRLCTADLINPEKIAGVLQLIDEDQLSLGDLLVVRDGATPEKPSGSSGHVYVFSDQGLVSMARDLSQGYDGIVLTSRDQVRESADRTFTCLRALSDAESQRGGAAKEAGKQGAVPVFDFFQRRFSDIYSKGFLPAVYFLKQSVSTKSLAELATWKKDLQAILSSEYLLAIQWVKALKGSAIYKAHGEKYQYYHALLTNKLIEYLLIAKELLKSNLLEDIKAGVPNTYSIAIEPVSEGGVVLSENMEWEVHSPLSSSTEGFPRETTPRQCLGSPVVGATTLLAVLGKESPVEASPTIYPIPLSPLAEVFPMKSSEPKASYDMTGSKFVRADEAGDYFLFMPHRGFVFGGPGERVADVWAAESSGLYPPHDCTSILVASGVL